jgi:hypothetical protein
MFDVGCRATHMNFNTKSTTMAVIVTSLHICHSVLGCKKGYSYWEWPSYCI